MRHKVGERSNIAVIGDDYTTIHVPGGPVPLVFYGHFTGMSNREVVRRALARAEGRLDDAHYMGRIIFDELVATGGGAHPTTGFGISVGTIVDNDAAYPIVHVDFRTQRVALFTELVFNPHDYHGIPFRDFILGDDPVVE